MATSAYDYVVVGAGSAGCLLANRLSGDGAQVLLLEAGGPSDRKLAVRAPAAFPTLFQGPADWNYLSEPEPGLNGRRWYLPRGRMLGGSSCMNAMLYVRGNRADFDGCRRPSPRRRSTGAPSRPCPRPTSSSSSRRSTSGSTGSVRPARRR